MTALALQAPLRVWYDARRRRQIFQALLLAVVLVLGFYFWSNATTNIVRRGLELGFGFLDRSANFAIGEAYIPYTPRDSYGRALLVGAVNTVIVAAIGCILTTILGIAFGIMRLSANPLLPRVVGAYVEVGRNVPLLLQLFFWYSLIATLGGPRQAFSPLPGVFLSNRGLRLPGLLANDALLGLAIGFALAAAGFAAAKIWADRRQSLTGRRPPVAGIVVAAFVLLPIIGVIASGDSLQAEIPELRGFNFVGGMELSPEFFTLLIGLTFYTTAFVTEIVRSGIQAVSKGQWEAGKALGLSSGRIMRSVVLPQALRVIIPPLTSQYLNLTKNSSLAIAIGYPDLVSVASTTINQTGQALEVIFVFMAIYLSLSLVISAGMNWLNAWVAEPKR
jgi:general L-amino acid transport system permease protein